VADDLGGQLSGKDRVPQAIDPDQEHLCCFFAAEVGLLPRGLFTNLLSRSGNQPERFSVRIEGLLTAMRDGGDYGSEALDRFNGGLFATIDSRRAADG
jgi:hypothetical protein